MVNSRTSLGKTKDKRDKGGEIEGESCKREKGK